MLEGDVNRQTGRCYSILQRGARETRSASRGWASGHCEDQHRDLLVLHEAYLISQQVTIMDNFFSPST